MIYCRGVNIVHTQPYQLEAVYYNLSLTFAVVLFVFTHAPVNSRSWMISPGLLSAGPVRLVIDMIQAARGSVTVSAVLSGLLSRLRGDGPALAADAFAAIVVSEAPMLSGEEAASADDCDSNLPSQVTRGSR